MRKFLSISAPADRIKPMAFPAILSSIALVVIAAFAPDLLGGEPSQDFTFGKVELELLRQSDLLDQKLEKEGLVYTDPALTAYLEKVGQSVVPKGGPPERVRWRFRALRDPLANAFALGNGSIYVNTGLLSLLENEAQLASVLAHEVTHVLNRHVYQLNRNIRKKMVAAHVFQAVGTWVPVGGAVGATISAIAGAVPVVLVATVYGYSRELEKEADLYGLARLRESAYDPKEMSQTFKRLQQKFEVELSKVYYNDHPKLQQRIDYIEAALTEHPAPADSDARESGRERYLVNIEKAAQHNVHMAIQSGTYRTAVALAQKLVDFNPKSSDNYYYLAEACRSLGPRTPEPSEADLSSKGKKETKKLKQKATLDEEEKTLMATPAGQAAWQANQIKAEELYRQALALDSNNAKVYSGLGFLFEKAQKPQPALEAYRRYLDLQPAAHDRLRIARRIEALEGNPKLKTNRLTTEPR